MGDWLMENGDRSFHSGDFAYDTDNDAWCEMGSSPGSTPVWWRKYGDSGGASSDRQLTAEELAKQEQRKREAEKWSNYVQRTEKEIENKRAHADDLDSKQKGGKYFAITVGIVDLIVIVLACFVNIGLLANPWLWFDLAIYGTFIGGMAHLIIRAVFETSGSSERKKADAMETDLENQKKQHRKQLLRGRR